MPKGPQIARDLVDQVIAKIRSASHHANDLLSSELTKKIDQEYFWIHNGYSELRAAYEFYANELREAMARLQKSTGEAPVPAGTIDASLDAWAERVWLEKVVSYRAFPLLVSFFSLLEFLLDVFYAFERPPLSFLEFRKLNWQDRFKAAIHLPPGGEILRRYERLLQIRRLFRNPLTHGLTNETSLLVPFQYGGLVPVSYEHFKSAAHFGQTAIPQQAASEALETFDGILSHLGTSEPFAFYIRYAEFGFSIPIRGEEIAAIESEMQSLEMFERYMQERSAYLDAVTNRDI
jgi:hypothetical protein